jgi:hypothetical protein
VRALASAAMALLHTPLPPRPLTSIDLHLAGATVATVLAGAIGAGLDTAHGAPARTLFAVFLALGAALSAAAVRREHLLAAVVMVPLAYLGLLLVGGLFSPDYSLWIATAFVVKAPVVLVATASGAVVAVVRAAAAR